MAEHGLSDDVARTVGRDAQRNNILAAKLVAGIVRTTLGPKGMDKMLVDSSGDITVTNDGVTILDEMELEHPAAKMVADVARTQEQAVGDGTTTAVVLAGALLEQAEDLLDKKIHPTVIVNGYRVAAERALGFLQELAVEVSDEVMLRQIAMTAMTGKGVEGTRSHLAGLLVRAVDLVTDGKDVERSDLSFVKVRGERIEDSALVQGVVLEQGKANAAMPSVVENSRVLLLDAPLEIRQTDSEARISVSSPEQLEQFFASEEKYLQNLVGKIEGSGANVVFCQKGIDDVAQYYLAKRGILAVRRVPKSSIIALSRALNCVIVSNVKEISSDVLGRAAVVREKQFGDDSLIFVEGCENPRAVTLVVRGGTEHVLAEVERALQDALGDVVSAVRSRRVAAGGGAVEVEVARRLRGFGRTLGGREQLAVERFADALESIPEALAENAGLDPIDVLTELRKRHEGGEGRAGLNLFNDKIEDTVAAGIVEPLQVKTQAVQSATEVATMLLRIDDVLVRARRERGEGDFVKRAFD